MRSIHFSTYNTFLRSAFENLSNVLGANRMFSVIYLKFMLQKFVISCSGSQKRVLNSLIPADKTRPNIKNASISNGKFYEKINPHACL